MFDIGFWELALLGVIGLIVLGPERLPAVARTVGLWVGRAKLYLRNLSGELERETGAADMRREFERTRGDITGTGPAAEHPAGDDDEDDDASGSGDRER